MANLTPVDFDPFAEDGDSGPTLTAVDYEPEFTEVDFDPFADEQPEGDLTWEDHGRSIMAGGAQVGAGMGWLAERAGQATGWEGLENAGSTLEQVSNDAADTWREGLSDYAGQVEHQQFLKEDPDSWTGYEWGDAGFDKVKMMLSQSLLGTAAGMGAGAGMTGALSVLPGVSRGVAATLGFSSGEALIAAPAAGAQAEQEVRGMSHDDLNQHVEYQALLLEGKSETEAMEILARAAGGQAAATTAISTAILSSPFGKILDDVMGGNAGGMVSGLIKGGATEAAQEAVQSGAEQLSVNASLLMNADVDRSLMQDVPEAVVGGAAAGAAMGGAFGVAGGAADGSTRRQQADMDRQAEEAAEAARIRGGDALDEEIARQQVYMDGEAVEMPTESFNTPDMPAGPDAPIQYNPFQQSMEPINIGNPMAEDGFAQDDMLPYAAPDKPGLELAPLDQPAQAAESGIDFTQPADKAAGVEKAMEEYQQKKEQDSYEEIFQGPKSEPVAPDADLGESGPSGREQQVSAARKRLEAQYTDAEKVAVAKVPTSAKQDMQVMELQQYIVRNGTLDAQEAIDQGIDPEMVSTLKVNGRKVFKDGGKSFEHMAEAANEDGFFSNGQEVGPNSLLDLIGKSSSGQEVYTPKGAEGQASREAAGHQMDEIQQRLNKLNSHVDEDNDTPPLHADYTGIEADRQELSYTHVEAELAGVDDYTIDYILDADLSDAEANTALKEAISRAKQHRQAPQPQGTSQGGSQGDNAPSRGQGSQAEGDQEQRGADQGTGDSRPVDLFGVAPEQPELAPELHEDPEVIDNSKEFQQRQIDVDDTQDLDFTAPESDDKSDSGFSLEQVQQDNTKKSDLADYTPAEDRASEWERMDGVLADKTAMQLGKMLAVAGVDITGLSNEGMIQRVKMLNDVMKDMARHESRKQFMDSVQDHAHKERILAIANMLHPKGAKLRSAAGTYDTTNTIAQILTYDGKNKLPYYTAAEKVDQDKKESEGFAKARAEQAAKDAASTKVSEYLTPERGQEVADWWDGESANQRERFLAALGFGNDKRIKLWIKRNFNDTESIGKTKRGIPREVKAYAEQYLSTFWNEFKADPLAFENKHTMPTELPPLAPTTEQLGQIAEAAEKGLLFNELGQGSIDAAAQEAATSPENDYAEPTDAQKEAGNYKKGHVRLFGLNITIENPKGSTRSGTDESGEAWSNTMGSHYGYIKGTEGADGDHVDVFIGEELDAENVYVVDQFNQDGSFDEHKAMLGFGSEWEAEQGYLDEYHNGWDLGPVTEMPVEDFKSWVEGGDTKSPLSGKSESKAEESTEVRQMNKRLEVLDDLLGCLVG